MKVITIKMLNKFGRRLDMKTERNFTETEDIKKSQMENSKLKNTRAEI